jgi:hypothetical protein
MRSAFARVHVCRQYVRALSRHQVPIVRSSKIRQYALVIARPSNFDEDSITDWSEWVLENRLPALPPSIERGESVPVARWVGPRFAAVWHLQWMWSEDPSHQDYLSTMVETFRRLRDTWEITVGAGGSDWPYDPPLQRPVVPSTYVSSEGRSCSSDETGSCCSVDWIVGTGVAGIQVLDNSGVTTLEIDSPLGIALVAVDGALPADISFLDRGGTVLTSHHFDGDVDHRS